ncbi:MULTISPECIES: hypothetical protein [unclassified Streptomyces]|uniref:hypothetical protein n=1 Tax=unclassified Streptomyces TaxID=2593676 RepID=UPI0035DE1559
MTLIARQQAAQPIMRIKTALDIARMLEIISRTESHLNEAREGYFLTGEEKAFTDLSALAALPPKSEHTLFLCAWKSQTRRNCRSVKVFFMD